MSDLSVIAEFAASLGFKIDDNSISVASSVLRKFGQDAEGFLGSIARVGDAIFDAFKKTTTATVKEGKASTEGISKLISGLGLNLDDLATGAGLAGAAVVAAFATAAYEIGKMSSSAAANGQPQYFQSKLLGGDNPADIQATNFAMSQIGMGAGAGAAALQSLAAAVRGNPGLLNLANGLLGANIKMGANGIPQVGSQNLVNILEHLKRLAPYIREQLSSMLGLGSKDQIEQMILNLPQFEAALARARKTIAATGQDQAKAAAAANQWEISYRNLTFTFQTLGKAVENFLMEETLPLMKAMDRLSVHVIPDLRQGLASLVQGLAYLEQQFESIEAAARHVYAAFQRLTKVSSDVAQDLSYVGSKFEAVFNYIKSIELVSTPLKQFEAGLSAIRGILDAIADLLEGHWSQAWKDYWHGAQLALEPFRVALDGIKEAMQWIETHVGNYAKKHGTPAKPGQNLELPFVPNAWLGGDASGLVHPASWLTGVAGGLAGGINTHVLQPMHAVSMALLATVAGIESNFNANAVSPAGAVGMFQMMPGTARQYGVTDRRNPLQEMRGAASYLGHLLNMFGGNVAEALAGYNWGEGNVLNDLRRWGDQWLAHVPKETYNYVKKGLAALEGFRDLAYAGAPPGVGNTTNNHQKSMVQHNTFNTTVTSTGLPTERTLQSVADNQRRVHANLIRNLSPI